MQSPDTPAVAAHAPNTCAAWARVLRCELQLRRAELKTPSSCISPSKSCVSAGGLPRSGAHEAHGVDKRTSSRASAA